MSWIIGICRWVWDSCKEKRRRDEREQDRSDNFELVLEIKPRDGHLQVTAKVVNHNLFSIHIERVEFYFPPAQTNPMKHGDSRGGEVKSKATRSFHFIRWEAGSAEDVRLISPDDLKIEATTATGTTQTINGEQIKAAALDALDALERSH